MLIEQIILENRLPKITELYALKVGNQLLNDPTASEVTSRLRSKDEEQVSNAGAGVIKHIYDEIDPTPNGTYTQWLVKNYAKGGVQYEDLYKYNEYFEIFHRLKQRLDKKDINQYSAEEFGQDMFLLRDRLEQEDDQMSHKAQRRQAKREFGENVTELYSDDDWEIYMPLNKKGCIAVGGRTSWCTATTNNNYADSYLGRGTLYVWQSLNSPEEKYQMHVSDLKVDKFPLTIRDLPRPEFRDRTDATIYKETIKKLPKVKAIVQKVYGKGLGGLVYSKMTDEPLPSDFSKIVGNDPKMAILHLGILIKHYGLASEQVNEYNEKYEPLFRKDPIVAYTYAKNILNGPYPAGEDAILTGVDSAVKYLDNVVQRPYDKLEPILATDAKASKDYSIKYLKDRFPEGEQALLNAADENSVEYASEIIKGRWPDLEKAIIKKKDADTALSYFLDVADGDWPEGLALIKSNDETTLIIDEILSDESLRDAFFGN